MHGLIYKIIEVNKQRRKVVGSIREVVASKKKEVEDAFWANIAEGGVYTGNVRSLTNYGAFIRLENGVSGLVHISQMSTKRVKSPEDVVKTGDTVNVKVIDKKDGKLSLSMKALMAEEAPVETFDKEFANFKSDGDAATNLGALLKGFTFE